MATVAVVVCNRCEVLGKPTRPYTIKQGRRQQQVDLCDDDSEYLETLLGGKPQAPKVIELPPDKLPAARRVGGRRRGGRVVTMDEIERLKKPAKRA